MACGCGKPKCNGKCGISPAVLQINNSECTLFHRVDVPASMGDSTENPPKNGAYRNVLLYYEADENAFLYNSDGIPTRITGVSTDYNLLRNKPSINDTVLIGNKTLAELGIIDAIDTAVAGEAAIREEEDGKLSKAIDDEEADRIAADNRLWDEIETIEAASDVVDVVGSYAELEAYDTSKLHDNDLIKVLQDETRDDAITYYRWSTTTETFSYVGEEGPYYTQSETDTLLGGKQDTLIAGSNIQIASDGKTISATDTTYTAGTGITLSGTEFSADNSVVAFKSDLPTKTSDLTNDGADGTSTYAETDELPTKTSDLTNDGADGTDAYAEMGDLPTKTSDLSNDGDDGTSPYATEDYVDTYGGKIDKIEVNGVEQAIVNKTVDITVPTKTSDITNDGSDGTSTYVEADELATVATTGSYTDLSNTPTIGDATLTIQKNSTTIDTFTANATSNKTIDISVPVDTSDLNNDGDDGTSPYATQDYVDTYGGKIDKIEVNGVEQTITNKTVDITVPTKTSDLTNDGSDGTSTYVENDDLTLDLATKQDKLIAGSNIQIAADGKTISATDTTYSTMTGATSQDAGTSGLVPAPAAGDDTKYLSGDGLWKTISQYQLPIASDSTLGGVKVGSNLSIDSSTGVLSANVNNATLTIQKNGTSAGTFTANASSNKTINITVPTTAADVSALPASTKYAASISVSVDTTDYKITTTLKDQDGNTLGTAQVIDLPLESVVVSGSYDNVNKKIVLTLENGNTVDIPVGDLVAGLQSEITSSNKLASDLVDDTDQANKFMTAAEKTKLAGIATGAEVNVQSDWNQTNNAADDFIKNKPTIPDPEDYYWANVKVSDTSSTSTAPSFGYMKLTRTNTYPHIGGDGTYLAMSADGQWGQGHGSIALKADALYPSTNESGLINLGEASRLWKNLYLSGDMYHGTYKLTLPNKAGTVALTSDIPAIDSSLSDSSTNPVQNKIVTAALNSRVNFVHFVTEGSSLYKKVKISGFSTSSSNVGVTIYGRTQIFMAHTMAASGWMGYLYEIGTNSNNTAVSTNNRNIHIKMKNTSGTPPYTTFYIAMDAYTPCDIWSDGTIEVSDSTSTEWNGITSDVTSTPIAKVSDIPTVDSALSDSSTNPVQNKVVKAALDGKLSTSGGAITGAITRTLAGSGTIANTNLFTVSGSTDGFKMDYSSTTADKGITTLTTTDDANASISIGNTVSGTYTEAINVTNGTATIKGSVDKLTTARTIALGTGATGTATSFDGSSDITIPVTDVKDAYVTWGGKAIYNAVSPDDAGCIDEFGHNKLAFLPAGCIQVHYSTNGGSTWTDYGLTDAQKIQLVTYGDVSCKSGKDTAATSDNVTNLKVRIRIATAASTSTTGTGSVYTDWRKVLLNVNDPNSDCSMTMRYRTIANYKSSTETWVDSGTTYSVRGGSGWNSIPRPSGWPVFGGSYSNQTSQIGQLEFILSNTKLGTWGDKKGSILSIRMVGLTNWQMPSEMARTGRLYTINDGKNATFPASIYADSNIHSYNLYNRDNSGNYGHIGASDKPFKDIYLSDGIYNGSTHLNLPTTAGTLALTSDLDSKVDVASISLEGQTTTILAQVQALAAANKDYGRFSTDTDGGSSGISDKPTGTTNCGFCCTAYRVRDYGSEDTYYLTCYCKGDLNPYTAMVAQNHTSISWSRMKPTVNNGTLTIQKNGTNVQTFTANQSTNATANITVPTKISDLTNTSGGFVTFCTCTSAATATTKTATVDSGDSNWVLRKGTIVGVKYTNTNTASATKLNVGGTGDKSVYYNTAVYTGTSTIVWGNANRFVFYMYDGTNWVWISDSRHDGNDNTYTTAYCSTAADTAAKAATMTGYVLTANRYTVITFTNANSYAGALTLNINGKGAKPLYINGAASSSSNYTLAAGSYIVYYDGTNYHIYNNGEIPRMLHSDSPTSVVTPSTTIPGSTINDGSITFAKTATGEFLKLQLSTVDIGEGASLPANTLYGVYE